MKNKRKTFTRNCQFCSKEFQADYANVAIGNGRFCSQRCSTTSRAWNGEKHPHWKGGKSKTDAGYILATAPNHPRNHMGYVREHILIAEKALGRPLPKGVEIHHLNENKSDNRNQNLVICENHAYHMLLHKRARMLGIKFSA